MTPRGARLLPSRLWSRIGTRFLPFADAASEELPLPRLLRLSLFQVSVGMAMVLLNGTLNRVMIVELGISATLVALMVALPLLFAPLARADRPQVRHPPLGARLAARALYLVRHAAAVRRPRDHAVRAAGDDRRRPVGPAARRACRRRSPSCWSAPACHDADRRPRAGHRPRARTNRGRASSRCST